MNFIKLFISLSCVSAAFVPKLSRSLAVKFNRLKGQERGDHSEFHAQFSLPQMPSIPNPLPIAFCDNDPKNVPSKSYGSSLAYACEDLGLINYHAIIEWAVAFENYSLSNWAIDHLIARHQPELASPNYKTGPENNCRCHLEDDLQEFAILTSAKYARGEQLEQRAFFYIGIKYEEFYCDKLNSDDIERFNFYKKLFYVFHKLRHEHNSKEPNWIAELRRFNVHLMFYNCEL